MICTTVKNDKGNTIYMIKTSEKRLDPVIKLKTTFDCTSYCISMQYGPETKLNLVCDQWQENKLISTDTKSIIVASNIKKRISTNKRARNDSSDDE